MSKTLEDYAVEAMNALVIAGLNSGAWEDYDDLAKSAFMIAESMIKVRDKVDDAVIKQRVDEQRSNAFMDQLNAPKVTSLNPFDW